MSEAPFLPLRSARLIDLVADTPLRSAAGIREVTNLHAGGTYSRRVAEFANAELLHPDYLAQYVELTQNYGPLFVAALDQPAVLGMGSVITCGGVVVYDSVRAVVEQGLQPIGLEYRDGQFDFPHPSRSRRIEKPAFLAKSPWWRNYGHWLLDSALLLAIAERYVLDRGLVVVVGRQTDAGMRAVVRECLDRLVPGVEILEHDDGESIVFSELHYASPVSVSPLFKAPAAIRSLRARLLPEQAVSTRSKLYLKRDTGGARRIVNEDEVIQLCESYGFQIVQPERYPVRAQAALFAGAEAVVGVKGAAFTNLLFSPSDCTAIVISPNSWIEPIFWDLAGQLGIRYIEVAAERPSGAAPASTEIVVDLAALKRAFDRSSAAAPSDRTARPRSRFRLPEHAGAHYRQCLDLIHRTIRPASYLEIGCEAGDTLALARCPSIGIDPAFKPQIRIANHAEAVLLFQMTSDEFFARHNPFVLLERHIGLAFIDGMHRIENALRDFINIEAYCRPESLIVLHDCVPLDHAMACRDMSDGRTRSRSCHPEFWTGDVWKLLPILARYRPDLKIRVFNAPPSGLVLMQRLNPGNRVLREQAGRIRAEWQEPEDEEARFEVLLHHLTIEDTEDLVSALSAG